MTLRKWLAASTSLAISGVRLSLPVRTLCAGVFALSTMGQAGRHLPVTIEALKDVPAHAEEGNAQKRGVLYVDRGQSFTVRKGERFLMVKINQEGSCRIEFEKRQYDVSSCPWLDGFRDHQEDVFKVVSGRAGRANRR